MMRVARPFGYMWAGLVVASGMLASVRLSTIAALQVKEPTLALRIWQVLTIVQDGLGGGVEVVGGVWVLLLSLVGLRTRARSPLAWLGLMVGVCGVLTVIPALRSLGMVFGHLQIPWLAGLGFTLLRSSRGTPVERSIQRQPTV